MGARPTFATVALCLALGAAAQEPDAEAGRALTQPCIACHGEDGNSPLPSYPSVAGQNLPYLIRQMTLMRDGEREAPLMAGQLDNLSDQDIADIAAFYAGQQSQVGQASPDTAELGQTIYRGGILAKSVPACSACHAPDGSGNPLAGFPSLSGQQPGYVVDQLTAYREGERTTDEQYGRMMRQSVANLTDGEIAALANYLFGLH